MLEALDDSCFCDSGLEEFQAPLGLKEINYSAFCDCKNLKRVLLNEGLTTLWRAFQGTHIDELTVPSTLKEYNTQAFCDCDSLKLVWVEDTRIESLLPTGDGSVGVLRQSIRLGNTLL